jgi:hypothetical protein
VAEVSCQATSFAKEAEVTEAVTSELFAEKIHRRLFAAAK